MNKKSNYWLILSVIVTILVVDAYYQFQESMVPIWQTEWFLWRVIAVIIFLIGAGVYFYISVKKKNKDAIDEFKIKVADTQENEWKRIAGELHDSVGQNLSAINIFIQQNIKLLADDSQEKQNLLSASEMLVETLDEVRRISSKLYPQQIERLGLTVAIESMLNKLTVTTGINFEHEIDNIDNIFAKEMEIYFYRIIQEALSNIIRHAETKNASVKIKKSLMFIQVEIEDEGKGFDITKAIREDTSKLGFGLLNLDERIRMLKGTYEVESGKGMGTHLKIVIPIKLKGKR